MDNSNHDLDDWELLLHDSHTPNNPITATTTHSEDLATEDDSLSLSSSSSSHGGIILSDHFSLDSHHRSFSHGDDDHTTTAVLDPDTNTEDSDNAPSWVDPTQFSTGRREKYSSEESDSNCDLNFLHPHADCTTHHHYPSSSAIDYDPPNPNEGFKIEPSPPQMVLLGSEGNQTHNNGEGLITGQIIWSDSGGNGNGKGVEIESIPHSPRGEFDPFGKGNLRKASKEEEREIEEGGQGNGVDDQNSISHSHSQASGMSGNGSEDVGMDMVIKEEEEEERERKAACESESEKGRIAWWRVPLEVLKYCVFKVSPVWSLSMAAAAVMGFVLLRRRWLYKMKRKSQGLQLKVTVDDKKAVSQFMSRAARLNEAFSVVKRVPIIRPSLPAPPGLAHWPVMSLR